MLALERALATRLFESRLMNLSERDVAFYIEADYNEPTKTTMYPLHAIPYLLHTDYLVSAQSALLRLWRQTLNILAHEATTESQLQV